MNLKCLRATGFCVGLAIPLLPQTPAAPLPAQILTAKKVFVAYAGNDAQDYLTGDQDRPYRDFYAALKAWGRYDLVGAPSDADLLFEIRLTIHPAQFFGGGGLSANDVQLRLAIRDPKTRTPLWTLTEHVRSGSRKAERNVYFGQALAKLVSDVQLLTAQPAAPAGASK